LLFLVLYHGTREDAIKRARPSQGRPLKKLTITQKETPLRFKQSASAGADERNLIPETSSLPREKIPCNTKKNGTYASEMKLYNKNMSAVLA